MAAAREYELPAADFQSETKYTDLLLVGWAKWASPERGPQPPTPAGTVLRIPSVRDPEYELRISDDEFVFVDSRIAILIARFRQIVDLEYRGLWRGRYWLMTQEDKWGKLGIRRTAYSDRLAEAQRTLYKMLKPHVDQWRARAK